MPRLKIEWNADPPAAGRQAHFSSENVMCNHRSYLEIAVREAEAASKEGTFPVGAVLVGGNGQILSVGRNRVFTRSDYTSHAEVDVIRQAGKLLMARIHAGKCTLYTTCEPCLMCAGALVMANIAQVVWILNDDSYGAMRPPYDGPRYRQHFSKIVMSIANAPDLEARLRVLPLFRASLKEKEYQVEEMETCPENKKPDELKL